MKEKCWKKSSFEKSSEEPKRELHNGEILETVAWEIKTVMVSGNEDCKIRCSFVYNVEEKPCASFPNDGGTNLST